MNIFFRDKSSFVLFYRREDVVYCNSVALDGTTVEV